MYTSAVLSMCMLNIVNAEYLFSPHKNQKKLDILPWVGVLKVQQGTTEALSRLVFVGNRKAIGNANEISKLDMVTVRKFSTAIFFENNTPYYCNVSDYSLHPEFYTKTPNTIAVVNIEYKKQKWFQGSIQLPIHSINLTNAYAIGLFDYKSKELEQSIFSMLQVNKNSCKDFYKNEGLDFKNYWPKHLLCYKTANLKHGCVFDSAMALAVKHRGNWILAGLGILGPGCALPSRYINIQPYVPWINYHIREKTRKFRNLRRQYGMMRKSNRTAIDPSKDIVSDSHGNVDDFYVDKLNDATMAVRPAYANVREQVYGACQFDQDPVVYRDGGIVHALHLTGTGIYALSLYDLRVLQITCVMVTVKCRAKSITKFWYERGFRKDDFAQFIKVVPHPKNERGTVPPKVLYLTDHYHQYDNITTANIVFKFEFKNEATINVDFYGKLFTKKSRTIITTTPARTRTTKTYPRYVYFTPSHNNSYG